MRRLTVAALALSVLALPWGARAVTVTATMDLGTPVVAGGKASIDVSLLFPGSVGDRVAGIQLDVSGSSAGLTTGGTDYSRFAFTPDVGALPGWLVLATFGPGAAQVLLAPSDPINGPFLGPEPAYQHLGILEVDLAGLPAGTTYLVTVAAGAAPLYTDLAGRVGGVEVPSFREIPVGVEDPADLIFADPNGVAFQTPGGVAVIPEPLTAGLSLLGLAAAIGYGCRRLPSARRGWCRA